MQLDRLDMSATTANSFEDLSIFAGSGGTLVAHGSGTVFLENVAVADLTADDFIFG